MSMHLPQRIKPSKEKAKLGFTSLLQEKGRDILVFAFFFAISAGFWLMQKLDDTFVTDIKVPLELVGVPEGTIITSPLPKTVTITIQDRGANLLHYIRYRKEIQPIRLDFAVYNSGSITAKVTVPLADIQRSFQQQMLSSTQVKLVRPSTLEFHYNKGIRKRMPVKLVGSVTTRSENYLQDITFQPDTVTVYAPSEILDTLKYAYTSRTNIKDLGKTSDYTIQFPKMSGVKVIPDHVQMTAHVDYYTEQSMQVPVIGLNFPANMTLKTFPALVTVKYRVGASNARNIKPENFILAATYEELLNNDSHNFRLQLKSTPKGVSDVRIYPQAVEYLLEYIEESTTAKTKGRNDD